MMLPKAQFMTTFFFKVKFVNSLDSVIWWNENSLDFIMSLLNRFSVSLKNSEKEHISRYIFPFQLTLSS